MAINLAYTILQGLMSITAEDGSLYRSALPIVDDSVPRRSSRSSNSSSNNAWCNPTRMRAKPHPLSSALPLKLCQSTWACMSKQWFGHSWILVLWMRSLSCVGSKCMQLRMTRGWLCRETQLALPAHLSQAPDPAAQYKRALRLTHFSRFWATHSSYTSMLMQTLS